QPCGGGAVRAPQLGAQEQLSQGQGAGSGRTGGGNHPDPEVQPDPQPDRETTARYPGRPRGPCRNTGGNRELSAVEQIVERQTQPGHIVKKNPGSIGPGIFHIGFGWVFSSTVPGPLPVAKGPQGCPRSISSSAGPCRCSRFSH